MAKIRINNGSLFERYEKKYLLSSEQYQELVSRLANEMQMDEYGRHTICTIYYDTDDFSVISRCLEKPAFKQKMRLRSYGIPTRDSEVFLELKKKVAGITYKRRIALTLAEAVEYLDWGWPPADRNQNFAEIDWYRSQLPLKNKVLICYDRLALFGKEDASLRITFDDNIRWRDYHVSLERGDYGTQLLPAGVRLMEIKTGHAMPCWLVETLSDLAIYPTNFSKYGTIYQEHLAGREAMRDVG